MTDNEHIPPANTHPEAQAVPVDLLIRFNKSPCLRPDNRCHNIDCDAILEAPIHEARICYHCPARGKEKRVFLRLCCNCLEAILDDNLIVKVEPVE